MNLQDEHVVGVNANIEMDWGLDVSLCDKCVLGVNDDGGGGYCPKDFVHPIEGLKCRVGHAQLVGGMHV